ncbi:coenzyme gamma-F420-2:alpha-L-glutamate ligase [Methanocaldococcus indicus]|uniref:coenzyme gamma-F420-2:alpha-L-glutamate ligase n=1 Tax=Methanocaldococcus indicus TaxID=213231 RepID=UPI003C6D8899
MIVILSPEGKSETIYRIKREVNKLGEKCNIFLLNSNNYILDLDFNIECDLIHPRCGIGFYNNRITLYSWQFMNSLDCKFINPLDIVYLTSDKFKTLKILKKKVLVPKTALVRDFEDAIKFMEKNNLNFPIVVKSNFSKCGETVFKANNLEELKNLTKNALWDSILVQEYIDFKSNGVFKDIRVLVLDGEIVGAYSRVSKDFRTNLYLGNKVENVELNKDIEDIVEKCYSLVEAPILGIDILPTKDGYYVLELNSAPGTKGFRELNKNVDKEIAKLLVEYAKK